MTTEKDYAAFAAIIYNNERGVRTETNRLDVPTGWSPLDKTPAGFPAQPRFNNGALGFTGGAYINTSGEIVIAYKGTDFLLEAARGSELVGDMLTNVGLALGRTVISSQLIQAAEYYAEVKKWAITNGYNPANITFTGHSLGGGIASVMTAWTGHESTVFAQAPFQIGGLTPTIYIQAKAAVDRVLGATDAEFAAFTNGFGADSALQRFTAELMKLQGSDGMAAQPVIRTVLIAAGMDYFYNTEPSATTKTIFTTVNNAINFKLSDLAADPAKLKSADLLANAVRLYLDSTEQSALPISALKSQDAWQLQTGTSGMNWTGSADIVRDIVLGGAQTDVMDGGGGADILIGGAGSDFLTGGAGADTLAGGVGDDVLNGGTGSDTLRAGLGRDLYKFIDGDGDDDDTPYGGAGDSRSMIPIGAIFLADRARKNFIAGTFYCKNKCKTAKDKFTRRRSGGSNIKNAHARSVRLVRRKRLGEGVDGARVVYGERDLPDGVAVSV